MSTVRAFLLALVLAVLLASAAAADGRAGAEVSGHKFESEVAADFRAHGFHVIPASAWDQAIIYRQKSPRVAVSQAPYPSIYGHRAKMDFLVLLGKREILLEVKHQTVDGSADEKFPYIYLNALEAIREHRDYALLLSGKGFKPGAVAWVEKKAKETPGFHVFRSAGALFAWLDTLKSG